ncbi:SIR2 family protein [Bradyrhizobium sp. UFLA05-153]
MCNAIGTIVGAKLPEERSAYHELVTWISGTQRPHPVEVFTTNYDLLLEEAFESAKVPYFDGFSGGHAPFFDPVTVAGNDLPPRWSRLWKLHGSLGWKLDQGVVVRSGGYGCTELVYPDHLKYDLTQKQPYAALFERLKHFLLQPDTLLLAAGFSFRDAHICALLDEALAMNANAAVFAFQFQNLAQEDAACALGFDRPNLSVYAADGAVISGVAGKWRPGDPPKNWSEIRASFWGQRWGTGDEVFLLGDFASFCRFCALSHSPDLVRPTEMIEQGDAVGAAQS